MLVAQSGPTLWDLMDCRPPGSSVHGIFHARILEWFAISFSRGSSQPRDQTWVSCTAGRFSTDGATREAPLSVIKIHLFVRLALQPCNGALQLYPVFYGNWRIWFVGTRSRQKNGFYSRYLNYFISLMKSTLVNWNTSLARALWPVHSYLLIHCEFWVLEH